MRTGWAKFGPVFAGFVALLLLAPTVSAAQYGLYPPWASGTATNTQAGSGDRTIYELWANKQDGTGKFWAEVLSTIWESAWFDADIRYSGNRFTPGYSGTYTITASWYIGGMAEVGVGTLLGGGSARVRIAIYANLKDVGTGYWVLGNDAATVILDYSWGWGPYWQRWDWNNALFTVSFSEYLYAGRTYEALSYLEGYIFADAYFAATNYAKEDFSSRHSRFVASGGRGGGGCVAEGTMILLSDGSEVAVEKLKPGDQVMAYDLGTETLVPVTVTSRKMTRVAQVQVINEGLLTVTTTDQPFYVRNGTWEGWIRNPSELRTGMELFRPVDHTWKLFRPVDHTWITVYSIVTEVGNFRVFDLATDPINNFVANGFLADVKRRSQAVGGQTEA